VYYASKNNVKMIKSVDTSKFLENNKITKCKFSIDDAVKFQRQTIKPRNKFYQKSIAKLEKGATINELYELLYKYERMENYDACAGIHKAIKDKSN
jgi:hypothetical protein